VAARILTSLYLDPKVAEESKQLSKETRVPPRRSISERRWNSCWFTTCPLPISSPERIFKDGRYTPSNDKRTVKDAYDSWWKLSVEGTDNRSSVALWPTTRTLYLMTWTSHVEAKWGARKLLTVGAEEIATWQQDSSTRRRAPRPCSIAHSYWDRSSNTHLSLDTEQSVR
jgi:hypothetical protein